MSETISAQSATCIILLAVFGEPVRVSARASIAFLDPATHIRTARRQSNIFFESAISCHFVPFSHQFGLIAIQLARTISGRSGQKNVLKYTVHNDKSQAVAAYWT